MINMRKNGVCIRCRKHDSSVKTLLFFMLTVFLISACVAQQASGSSSESVRFSSLASGHTNKSLNQKLFKYIEKSGKRCKSSVVGRYLDGGASPNTMRMINGKSFGEPVIIVAASNGATGCALELIQYGAVVKSSVRDSFGNSSLTAASASDGCEPKLVKALIEHGANPNVRQGFTLSTPLEYAASQQNFGCAKELIENGAQVNATGGVNHNTALINAQLPRNTSGHDRENMTRLLLAHGADPNMRGPDGITALFFSVGLMRGVKPCPVCALLLIKAGANPNLTNKFGLTPLLWALDPKHETNFSAIKVLVDNGANVNLANPRNGKSPLMAAAALGLEHIVKMLLSNGANRCAKDNHGQTAADYALKNDHASLSRVLSCSSKVGRMGAD